MGAYSDRTLETDMAIRRKNELVAAVVAAICAQAAFVFLILAYAEKAGPHSLLAALLGLTQFPGVIVMSAVMPNEAAGGAMQSVSYYLGVSIIQATLFSLVLWAVFRIAREPRE